MQKEGAHLSIPSEFIREVKEQNHIIDVVGGYVNLKRSGRTAKGLCPFHSEKSPSFTVFEDTDSFYCFGCQTGGDVIGFIRKIENLDYVEAVRFLANRAGMTMQEDGRGLTDATIRHFGLGWSPDGWDALAAHLRGKGYKPDEMIAADLGFISRQGNVIDRFRNRVMFPIIDLQGSVIAFGGRVFTENAKGGKYVNTGDTLIYKKTNHLFAMNFAKSQKTDELILCEGYMDVIALHQAGFPNAVAALGTAVTRQQAHLMKKYVSRVVLSQDGDEAGQRSIARSIPIMKDEGLDVRVLRITGAKDPDEFIRKHGSERFRRLVDNCANDIEYSLARIEGQYDLSTDDGKLHFLREACEFLSGLSVLEREVYASRLADKLKTDKSALLSQIDAVSRRRSYQEKRKEFREMAQASAGIGDRVNPQRSTHLRAAAAEDALLEMLFHHQDLIPKAAKLLPPQEMVTEFSRRVYGQFITLSQSGQEITITDLQQEFSDNETAEIVRVVNGQNVRGIEDFSMLITRIKEEGTRTRPIDAAKLSSEELRAQIDRMRKKKS